VTVPKFDEVKSMFVFCNFNEQSITLRVILRNAMGVIPYKDNKIFIQTIPHVDLGVRNVAHGVPMFF
jgi:hypothetical protein